MKTLSLFVGYDPREHDAYEVCVHSVKRNASIPLEVFPIKLPEMRAKGLYTRTIEKRGNQMWDVISDAPMSTEFAITRFLTPLLAKTDWAVFCDCDFLWLGDIAKLLALAEDKYALMCVKHNHRPPEDKKMDDQAQVQYARKNWSSMMMFNCNHPSNKKLTVELINTVPGRDLHRFCWLKDEEIGGVPETWNWLEGHNAVSSIPPNVIHYTRGGPWFDHMKNCDYAKEWLDEMAAVQRSA